MGGGKQTSSGSRVADVLAALLVVVVGGHSTAYAYTDPGTGSLILQMLFAASVGVLFYARRAISWIRGALGRRPPTEPGSPDRNG